MRQFLVLFVLFNTMLVNAQSTNSIQIIPINDSLLKMKIGQSDKLYHVIVIYTDWCKPCRAFFPDLLQILGNQENIDTYFINPDPKKYTSIIKKYLQKYPEIKLSYILDESYKGSFKKRFISFKDQIYPQFQGLLGIPTVFILSKESKQIDIIVGNDPDKLKASLAKLR